METSPAYFILRQGEGEEQKGPFERQQIEWMLDDGQLVAGDLYWCDGMMEWRDVEELRRAGEPPPPIPPSPPPRNTVREEQEFFRAPSVLVTSARFIVDGTTYPVTNISSVKMVEVEAGCGPIAALAVFGLLSAILAMAGMSAVPGEGAGLLVFSAFMFALAVLAAIAVAKAKQSAVAITTAGGEAKALVSRDRGLVRQTVTALNEAIIYRG